MGKKEDLIETLMVVSEENTRLMQLLTVERTLTAQQYNKIRALEAELQATQAELMIKNRMEANKEIEELNRMWGG